MARMHLNGAGVPKDEAKAIAMFTKTCEEPDGVLACRMLGILYEDGIGTEADSAKAKAYLTKACGLGDSLSCDRLGAPER